MGLTFYLLMSTVKPDFVLWWNDFQDYGCSSCILCQNSHIYRSLQFCMYMHIEFYTHTWEKNTCICTYGEKYLCALCNWHTWKVNICSVDWKRRATQSSGIQPNTA